MDDGNVPDDQRKTIIDTTLTINSFFGWEFNSCEALRQNGTWHPIDFANACPDSQVTSLHYHFPWLVAANLRWSIFCAATKRRMRADLEWTPYFEIANTSAPYEDKLAAYGRSPTSASRPRSSSRSARRTSAISTASCGTSSPRRSRSTPFARRSPHCSCARDRSVHGAVLGPHPVVAGAERAGGGLMSKLTSTWHSPRIEREVTVVRWGTAWDAGARVPDRRR